VSIHVAVDGKQASEILAAGQFEPDLVILDLNLPKLSGLVGPGALSPTCSSRRVQFHQPIPMTYSVPSSLV